MYVCMYVRTYNVCVCVCVCVCVAGLVIKTRGKPAAVGSPSKKDGKAANGEEPDKTKAADEVFM